MENTIEFPFVYWQGEASDKNLVSALSHDFATREIPTNIGILIAVYTYESYSGKAFVLYEHDGKLFEVNGSHCSCYGLEGQFNPEETTWPALLMRDFTDDWYYGDYNPWNLVNGMVAEFAAERGFFPKEEKSALELQAWDLGEGQRFL
jgi:hypothetical protein